MVKRLSCIVIKIALLLCVKLGRLREVAFRLVGGEGTGKRRDIDGYDQDYLHLVLWGR